MCTCCYDRARPITTTDQWGNALCAGCRGHVRYRTPQQSRTGHYNHRYPVPDGRECPRRQELYGGARWSEQASTAAYLTTNERTN